MALTGQETKIVDAIVAGLRGIDLGAEKDKREMAEANGQYRLLQADIENVRSEFHDFKTDVNLRFSEISTGIKGLETSINRLSLQPAPAAPVVAQQKNDSPSGIATVLGVAGLALAIAGSFGTVIKMNIDSNVAFAQERTTVAEKHLTEDMAALSGIVRDIQKTTVPRAELDGRFDTNIASIDRKEDKDVVAQVIARLDGQITYLRADLERVKKEIVSRDENASHWNDFQNRLNLLSDRVNDLAKSTNGASLADQIKGLQEQYNLLVTQAWKRQ